MDTMLRFSFIWPQVQELFRVEYGEVFHVQVPTSRERRSFFEDLILNQAAKAPASKRKAGECCLCRRGHRFFEYVQLLYLLETVE